MAIGTIRKLKNGTEIDEPAKLITATDMGTDQALQREGIDCQLKGYGGLEGVII